MPPPTSQTPKNLGSFKSARDLHHYKQTFNQPLTSTRNLKHNKEEGAGQKPRVTKKLTTAKSNSSLLQVSNSVATKGNTAVRRISNAGSTLQSMKNKPSSSGYGRGAGVNVP